MSELRFDVTSNLWNHFVSVILSLIQCLGLVIQLGAQGEGPVVLGSRAESHHDII